MSGEVRNGLRVAVAFGSYSGQAGVQDREGRLIEAAFPASVASLRSVTSGSIDGAPVEVLAVAKASYAPGMIVLTCRSLGIPSA